MSEFLIKKEVEGKAKGSGVIRDAMFCYVKMQQGDYKFQSTSEKEYVVDVIVDKATARAWKKAFSKNGFQEIETADFASKYKCHPPLEGEDDQYVIKAKSKVALGADVGGLSKGDDVPYSWGSRPKVYVPVENSDDVEDITMTTLVGNGSKGSISFDIVKNDFGTFPQLTGILVTDLVEYESKAGSSPFGHVSNKADGSGEAQQKAQVVDDREPPEGEGEDKPF